MQERCSERKIIWVVVALIGAQLMGVDITVILQVLSALLGGGGIEHLVPAATGAAATSVAGPVKGAFGSSGNGALAGNLALPALAGLYAWTRADVKKRREERESAGMGQERRHG